MCDNKTVTVLVNKVLRDGGVKMPVIAKFYGIIIKMYFQQSEHNPPHFHAVYGE